MKTTHALFGVVSLSALLVLSGCAPEGPSAEELSCTTGQTHTAVLTSLAFTLAQDDIAPGFDLDGRVSGADDYLSCGKADFVDPDGVPGIDNRLASLIPVIKDQVGDAVDGLVQGAINDGELVILLELENVDDVANDACVNVGVQVGAKKRPTLGTDGVIEAYQTFDPDPAVARSFVPNARIENGVLRTGSFPLAVPIAIFDVAFTIHMENAQLRFSIDEEGKVHGFLGGGMLPQELLDGVAEGAGVAQYLPAIKVAMEANTDLAYNDETGKCERFSGALEFSGTPAFVRR
ncbi:MAG: hypothetical protein IPM54_23080 [Polyangiaceae bacterium]|nr:hypothetical protein [Polyangiaceae bacterium]